MARHNRDPKYLHPILFKNRESILAEILSALPSDWDARIISAHRTPQEQFELFKKGREFASGRWVKVGATVTNIDGFNKMSRHNYLPALALDVGLFRPDGSYESNDPKPYKKVGRGARKHNLEWGGDWTSFVDRPHIQVPAIRLFQNSLVKDTALQWQKYLAHAGAYTGPMDGIFGRGSRGALLDVTGAEERTLQAWAALVRQFGPVHELRDFDEVGFIPNIT